MDVARREKFSLTRGNPPFTGARLTLRAVPVAAGVVRDGAMSAASAFIEMAAECGGATPRNGQQHFQMLPTDPLTVSFDECVACDADEIGQLIYSFRCSSFSFRESRGLAVACRWRCERCR